MCPQNIRVQKTVSAPSRTKIRVQIIFVLSALFVFKRIQSEIRVQKIFVLSALFVFKKYRVTSVFKNLVFPM